MFINHGKSVVIFYKWYTCNPLDERDPCYFDIYHIYAWLGRFTAFDEFYHNTCNLYKFLSLLGAGDCIFTFLAIHAISRSKRYGGEESQDFPENPYLLHCSHHKVHSPFGKLYNLICIKDE